MVGGVERRDINIMDRRQLLLLSFWPFSCSYLPGSSMLAINRSIPTLSIYLIDLVYFSTQKPAEFPIDLGPLAGILQKQVFDNDKR